MYVWLCVAHSIGLIVDEPVTELMKTRGKAKQSQEADAPTRRTVFAGRDGLAAYTIDPEAFPPSRVVYYNDKFVVIKDLYPKSLVHLLILPRDESKSVQRPQEAFDDPVFLAECREEEKKVRAIVASELRRKLGKYSAADQARTDAMEQDELPDELPPGRDWSQEVMSGTHANPSMNDLHIHVLSRDMQSECMKKTNHYFSFTTDFFIGMDEYPLAKGDKRRRYKHFPDSMACWRCGKTFGNKMTKLKEHLAEEFEEWKKQ